MIPRRETGQMWVISLNVFVYLLNSEPRNVIPIFKNYILSLTPLFHRWGNWGACYWIIMPVYSLVNWTVTFASHIGFCNTPVVGKPLSPNLPFLQRFCQEAAKQEGFLSFTYPVLAANNIEAPVSLAYSHLCVQRRSNVQLHFHKSFYLPCPNRTTQFDTSNKQTEKVF